MSTFRRRSISLHELRITGRQRLERCEIERVNVGDAHQPAWMFHAVTDDTSKTVVAVSQILKHAEIHDYDDLKEANRTALADLRDQLYELEWMHVHDAPSVYGYFMKIVDR
jgi:hypothetical protein